MKQILARKYLRFKRIVRITKRILKINKRKSRINKRLVLKWTRKYVRAKPVSIINKIVVLKRTRKKYVKHLSFTLIPGKRKRAKRLRSQIVKQREKRVYLSSLGRRKRQTAHRIKFSLLLSRYRWSKRNINPKSYFNRFILRKHRRIYKRTMRIFAETRVCLQKKENEENAFYIRLKEYHKARLNLRSRYRLTLNKNYLFNRKIKFSIGKIYISNRKHNTFMSVFNYNNKMIFKTSAGNEGYTGLKRPTKMGRESVAKATAKFIQGKFKLVDIIFIKSLSRRYYYIIRSFLSSRKIYVRYMLDIKRRAYSIVRRTKKRRI